MEVTRRLEERLREKEREDEDRRKKEEEKRAEASNSSLSRSPSKRDRDYSLPSGVLTPLLKKHKDLDDELRQRLQELEQKLCVHYLHSQTDSDPPQRAWQQGGPIGRRPLS